MTSVALPFDRSHQRPGPSRAVSRDLEINGENGRKRLKTVGFSPLPSDCRSRAIPRFLQAFAALLFATQLFGGILGPYVVGRVDDAADLVVGLQLAVLVMVAGALLMFLVMYFIRRDGLCHPEMDAFRAEVGD